MRKLAKLAALVALLTPALASAQLSLGARLGYAFPTGKVDDDPAGSTDLKDLAKYQIPLQVEAGWRLVPDLTLGAYFSAGIAGVGDQLDKDPELCGASGVDCSARVLRLGVQLTYAFSKMSPSFVPWVGVGSGWEWASVKAEQGSNEITLTAKGWEMLNLQGGADFKVGKQFAVGPFVQYTLGQYGRFETEDQDGNTFGGDVEDKAFHGWFQIGIRGRLDI